MSSALKDDPGRFADTAEPAQGKKIEEWKMMTIMTISFGPRIPTAGCAASQMIKGTAGQTGEAPGTRTRKLRILTDCRTPELGNERQRPIRFGSGAPEIKALPRQRLCRNGPCGPFKLDPQCPTLGSLSSQGGDMAEQITAPGDEGQRPEPPADALPSGQPSQAPPDLSPSAGYVMPGMAGPGPLAGSPEQAPAAGQPGELGRAADAIAQGSAPPPPRSRRRKVIVIAAAAVVLIAGGIGLGVALSSGSSPRFPRTLLGLTRNTGSFAQQATGRAAGAAGAAGIIVHPAAALYGTGALHGMLIVTGHWSAAAKAAGLISDTPARIIDGLKALGVTDATLFPAGPRGGVLACGHRAIGALSTVNCEWADGKNIGDVLYLGSASSLGDAAAKTIQVRSAVEH
jgi:hypothetical protein